MTGRMNNLQRQTRRATVPVRARDQARVYQRFMDVVAAEMRLRDAVADAREHGVSWSAVGESMGMSGSGAKRRFDDRPPRRQTASNGQLGIFEPRPPEE